MQQYKQGDAMNPNRCLLLCNQKQVNFLCCKQIKIATYLLYRQLTKIRNAIFLDETTIPMNTILYLSLYYLVNDLIHFPYPTITLSSIHAKNSNWKPKPKVSGLHRHTHIYIREMVTCAIRTHVKESKVEILSTKLCQFILLKIYH